MARKLTFLLIITLLFSFGYVTAQDVPPDEQEHRKQFSFTGQWRPDADPLLIGENDFSELQNWRYNSDIGIEGVRGYSKINTTAITTYIKPRSGIQLQTPYDVSHVLLQAYDTDLANPTIVENRTAIPDQGSFESTTLHTNSSGAELGVFSHAPGASIAFTNGVESLIWAGEEEKCAAVIRLASISGLTVTTPVDFTEEMGNTLATSGYTMQLSGSTLKMLIGSTRPITGMKLYVSSANTSSSSLTVEYWTGSTWSSTGLGTITDGTKSGGIALAQTGTVSFNSTVTLAKTAYIEGGYLYFYLVALSAGDATLSHITVDCPMQDIVDVWDGVYRTCTQFQPNFGGVSKDYTLEVALASNIDYPIAARIGQLDTTDEIIVMFDERVAGIRFEMLPVDSSGNVTVNTNAATATIKYWNGSAFATVGTVTDGTFANTASLNQTGVMTWNPPAENLEFPRSMFGISGYAYEITFSAQLSGADQAKILVDLVYGVPAQKTIGAYKFAFMYRNRLMLGNSVNTKEGNRVDFSAANAPDVWNGDESSDGGNQALYFGDKEELTCGTQIFNPIGSTLYNIGVLFKDTETYVLDGSGPDDFVIRTVSTNIGNPAPLSLATAEIGYEVAVDVVRNIVLWVSYRGPMLFDGSVIKPLQGVSKYFDPEKDTCINYAAIEAVRGWYDPQFSEYNILLPVGSSQTTVNTWIVYDLVKKRWFEKVPATYPQLGFQVQDTDGTTYCYGTLDTGYMMRLEYEDDWDGTSISYVLKTADILPTGNIWDQTRIRRFKLLSQAPNLEEGETVTISIVHWGDGEATRSTSLTDVVIDFENYSEGYYLVDHNSDYLVNHLGEKIVTYIERDLRHIRDTQEVDLLAHSHQFQFTVTSNSYEFINNFGKRLLGFGYIYNIEREDRDETIKRASSGTVYVVNNCENTSEVTSTGTDAGTVALDTTYVKQGTSSLKLPTDASASASTYSTFDFGATRAMDWSDYTDGKIQFWFYLPGTGWEGRRTGDGSSGTEHIQILVASTLWTAGWTWFVHLSELHTGWNLIERSLATAPSDDAGSEWGTIDFSNINSIRIIFQEVSGNTTDFDSYVDKIWIRY